MLESKNVCPYLDTKTHFVLDCSYTEATHKENTKGDLQKKSEKKMSLVCLWGRIKSSFDIFFKLLRILQLHEENNTINGLSEIL